MSKEFFSGKLSINKEKNSPYWMVTFEGPDGKMRRRSTKVPVSGGNFEGMRITAKLAEKLAYQRGVQIACATEEEYRTKNNTTVKAWLDNYLMRKTPHLAEDTVRNARTAYNHFYTFLGSRVNDPIRLITKADIKNFIDYRRQRVRAKTVRKDMAAISQAFLDAADSEIIDRNPCFRLAIPSDRSDEKIHKEAFTLEEIRYMIAHFPPLWSSAVRCCIETYGQRLGDILSLDWSQFDWNTRTVRFATGKTGRWLYQPMRDCFFQWAHARWTAEGCPANGLLHEPLLNMGNRASVQFGELLRAHGIGVIQAATGGDRRTFNSKSFHSIRATAATLLQSSGVAQGLAMELVGHDSKDVHAAYIRPNLEQLRTAANTLPEL